ncbi:MAG: hypothetical protein RLZZ76_552 [Candidatus Parcubacteria bacterium]
MILFVSLSLPVVPVGDGGMTLALVEAEGLVPCGEVGNPCNACDAIVMVDGLLSFLFTLLAFLAVIVMMYAGAKLVMSQGNSHEWEEAKGMLTNVIVGFVIVLAAWLVVDTLMKMLLDPDVIEVGMWNTLKGGECR